MLQNEVSQFGDVRLYMLTKYINELLISLNFRKTRQILRDIPQTRSLSSSVHGIYRTMLVASYQACAPQRLCVRETTISFASFVCKSCVIFIIIMSMCVLDILLLHLSQVLVLLVRMGRPACGCAMHTAVRPGGGKCRTLELFALIRFNSEFRQVHGVVM